MVRTKVKITDSGKHTFVNIKGPKMDIFRSFNTKTEAKNYIKKLKKSKYWR